MRLTRDLVCRMTTLESPMAKLSEYGDSLTEDAVRCPGRQSRRRIGSAHRLKSSIAFVERQNCNETRKHILSTALSLVGKVPYFWGGKSDAGWNDEWNTPKVVTATGSSATGTILPYGLDCSGYTGLGVQTAMGVSIKAGSWNQWDNSYAITEAELLPGDLGFMAVPGTVPVNHVLIYAGENEDGAHMWVHCTSGSGVVPQLPDYVSYYRRPINVDYDVASFIRDRAPDDGAITEQ